jgi:hypothetical protein
MFTVINDNEAKRFAALKAFFNEARDLAINHRVINDHAVILARDLGQALSKVDDHWQESQEL